MGGSPVEGAAVPMKQETDDDINVRQVGQHDDGRKKLPAAEGRTG